MLPDASNGLASWANHSVVLHRVVGLPLPWLGHRCGCDGDLAVAATVVVVVVSVAAAMTVICGSSGNIK